MSNNEYKVRIAYYYKNRLKEVVKYHIKKYLNIENLTEIGIPEDYRNKDIRQILSDYFEYTNRLIIPKKGSKVVLNNLLISNNKFSKYSYIIYEIKKELEEGINIQPRLTKFFKNYFFKDDKYRYYNIHHLHLTKEDKARQDILLLVYFDNEKTDYFLSIVDHNTFKNEAEIEKLLLDAGFRDILPTREWLDKLGMDKVQLINQDQNGNTLGTYDIDMLNKTTNVYSTPYKKNIKPFIY